jgi:hypothetical protein
MHGSLRKYFDYIPKNLQLYGLGYSEVGSSVNRRIFEVRMA